MPACSDSFEADIIDYFLRNQSVTQPTTVYLGLSSTTPTEAGGNFTEPSGNGYARQAVTWGAPSAGVSTNTNAITFGPNTGSDWGTMTYLGLFFASTGGTVKLYKVLGSSRTITVGASLTWAAGDLTSSFD